MTKNKHTQGPWKVVTRPSSFITSVVFHDDNQFTSIVDQCTEANAHLIASAPELYELLSKINTAFYTRSTRKEWLELMEQAKPLLRKARGE
jgi:hypothetical protein